jgi:F-type H+-transporting ATPase subunit a
MEHELGLTALFNDYLPGVGSTIFRLIGATPENAQRPWPNWLAMEIVAAVLLMLLVAIVRSSLSVDKPGKLQHIFEMIWGFINHTVEQVGIHDGRKDAPYIGTVFIVILFFNLFGMIPAFEAPTMVHYVPAGLAITTFVYFNYAGFRASGIKYLAHFAGPVRFSNPIATVAIMLFMIPIELISTCIRPLSLTVRLYGNMFAGEQVTNVFLDLTKLVIPVIFMGLHVFVSFVQAYVFTLLTTIYIAGATEHHDEHGDEHIAAADLV